MLVSILNYLYTCREKVVTCYEVFTAVHVKQPGFEEAYQSLLSCSQRQMQQKCTPHSLKYYREDDINSLDQRFCENGLIHSLPKTLSMLVHAVPTAEMQPSKAQLPSCPQKKSDIKSEFWANGQFCLAICYLGCYEIWYR